jgi:NhaA family Na+:H+ antiporter
MERRDTAGAGALLAATVLALAAAASPWHVGWERIWTAHDLRHWIDDGLMTVFFLVVGLELRREVASGELRDPRRVALPALAALGGMVVPAVLYLAIAGRSAGADGWGVPMATDIAFALGVLGLLGRRVPSSLRLFLLTLAIVDDIGAIVVIAIAYADEVHLARLALAVLGLLAIVGLRRVGVARLLPYLVVGVGVWWATLGSGVHATIAGVAVGLLLPVDLGARLEHRLVPWSTFVVVPAFALANAGVRFDGALAGPDAGVVALGVGVGLVVGKLVGVLGASWCAVRTGTCTLPAGTTWPQLAGIAGVAGIGFTVSLFMAGLAFDQAGLTTAAEVGILGGSLVAAVLGGLTLVVSDSKSSGGGHRGTTPGPYGAPDDAS